ncbi:MAG TPA: hypothetical protein VMU20_06750 [Candidatus Dormibacteraeota bacterium]|jgi:hypothetical protein|nr:hypothetical protein [Candidatus Dormibacteraeota bacterium]
MSNRRRVEIYTSFLRLSGELEGLADERLTDLVSVPGPCLELCNAAVEPVTEHHLRLGQGVERLSVVKASISLVCPRDVVEEAARHREAWREKERVSVQLNSQAFSMVCEVHLEPGGELEDHLCGNGVGFVPVTNLSALWLSGPGEPRAVQRGFGLVNSAYLVGFAPAPPR